MKKGCILLAAGAGVRFGGNKLKAKFTDKTVIEYILASLPLGRFSRCVIIAADSQMLSLAEGYGVSGMINDNPGLGIARSIRMGLETLGPAQACMFCVSDQPFLTRQTISAMLAAFEPGTILSLACSGKRGNPVIFPSKLFGELMRLQPGESGKTVIERHPDLLRLYEISDPMELMDIDTKEQLARMEKRISKDQ